MLSPDDTIRTRPANEADMDVIADFNCAVALETEGKCLDRVVVRDGVEEALRRPEVCRYYVAECEGRPVGQLMITYEWSDWRAGVFWWIQSVYVRPEFRRRGVFRKLYDHVAAAARQEPGVCGLRLYVEEANAQAMAAYERLGLRRSGHVVYECDWSASAAEDRSS